ncbi:hypothetical protein RHSIM_Rhsim02G0098400 [Rhododendron simsii]|uniref:Wax synthase domain-containing protein n=1 Tax=Rhododendron simsii TaxID=118357 RepID=A0A834HB14_RHOSS|nr:hypothetical protein RHSIM_Rhsim02G0098400 [Rhododendron simsii]
MLVSYGFHIYFTLEIILATAAAAARAAVRPAVPLDLCPKLLGQRWNLLVLVVSRTLRSTVYELAQVIGRKWALHPPVMCTFAISALMHEILFYYMGRLRPTWVVT